MENDEVVEEKTTEISDSSPDLSGDLSEIKSEIVKINDYLEKGQKIKVDGVEKTDLELLAEILKTITPDDEEMQVLEEKELSQQELLQSINDNIETLNKTLDDTQALQLESLENQNTNVIEGSYMISFSVLVGLGIYMFWSQLSKW